jgi:hypothetical protein
MSFKLISTGESDRFVRELGFAGRMAGRKICSAEAKGFPDRHFTESMRMMQEFGTPMAKYPYVMGLWWVVTGSNRRHFRCKRSAIGAIVLTFRHLMFPRHPRT